MQILGHIQTRADSSPLALDLTRNGRGMRGSWSCGFQAQSLTGFQVLMVVGRIVGHECLHEQEPSPDSTVCPTVLLTSINRMTPIYRPRSTRDSDKASVVISDHNRVLSAPTLTLDEDHQAPSSRTANFASIQLNGAYFWKRCTRSLSPTSRRRNSQQICKYRMERTAFDLKALGL